MRLAKKWFLVLPALLLALPALACPGNNCVRIGSWNIAWLGSEKREQASDTATIDAMANLIADEWSMDLISLEEINTELDGKVRGDQVSTASWVRLRSALEKKGYRTQAGSSGQAQHIVLAWRAPVKVLEQPQDMTIPDSYSVDEYCRSAGLRRPLAGKFRAGQFDFWAVGLHLKSGYGGNTKCANAVRSQQTYYLAKAVSTMEKSDRDVLLLGDFNASSKHDSLENLREKGFIALTDRPMRNADSNNRTQGIGKRGSVIDHIMVMPSATGEWINRSTMLYQPANPEEFNRRFSDHLPVWADFHTSSDDD